MGSKTDVHLFAAKAADLENFRERLLYRLLEIFPGALSLGTLAGAAVFSWLFPVITAFFIIAFVLYWFFRILYFAFHLRAGYRKARAYEKIHWIEKLDELGPNNYSIRLSDWKDLYHLVLVPTYQEPIEILRETLMSVQRSDFPKDKIIVVLGIEERAGKEAVTIAQALQHEFEKDFFRMLVTAHPADIPGEIAGKGSNETWATRIAQKEVIDRLAIPYSHVVVTSLDADTVLLPSYLSCLAYHYLTSRDPLHHSYQPIPLFTNNIWQASAISRIFAFSTTFWFLMNQERPEKLSTFSSHSMSFQALVDVGFKQTNFVSDDSRIFWQCFLRYDGNYGVQPLYYPISMDANTATSLWKTIRNIYKQQQRWAYGAADVPYFLFGFIKNKKIPLGRKISLAIDRIESYWSWATASPLIFILGWLPLLLGGNEFSQTLLAYNLPRYLSWILTVTLVGLVMSAYVSVLFLPPRPPQYPRWKVFWFAVQWLLQPFIMVFFALPALDAQIRLMLGKYMGFWSTPKFRK